jgi:mevalonate kinase
MKSISVEKRFPAKVLLFGEYTVLLGSSALAIPLNHFSGQWQLNSTIDATLLEWVYKIRNLNYDLSPHLLLDKFEQAVQNGLNFKSDIPVGYGLGSSGALTAALFNCYGKELEGLSLEKLRVVLSHAESCFHGKSSGIDPLVSYTGKPIRYQLDSGSDDVMIGKHNLNFYLVNSGISRETKTLVRRFNLSIDEDEEFEIAMNQLAKMQNDAINAFLIGDTQVLWEIANKISTIQLKYMNWLIPDSIISLFEEGIKSQNFVMKLCGAGGGGYFIRINSPECTMSSDDSTDWIPIVF